MTDQEQQYRQAMNQGHSAAWDLDWERAAHFYRQALEAKPQDFQALTSLALAHYELGQLAEAERLYIEAAQAHPQHPAPWEKLAQIYERRGEIQAAVQAAFQAAEAHARQKDLQKALENWKRVLRLDPEHLRTHTRLALIYERARKRSQAVEEYLNIAALLQARGKKQEALQAVEKALALVPNHPDALHARALLHHNRPLPKPKRLPGGTGPLRLAQVRQLETSPTEVAAQEKEAGDAAALDPVSEARQRALTTLAELLFSTAENGTDAEESAPASRAHIDALLQRTPSSPRARHAVRQRIMLLLGQGIDLQTQGNLEQAAAELERVARAGLSHPALDFDLGWLYFATQRPREAVPHLKEALLHPDYALAGHLLLGRIYHDQGQTKDAALEYLAALRQADALALEEAQHRQALLQLYDPIAQAISQDQVAEHLETFIKGVEELLHTPHWREKIRQARAQLPAAPEGAPPLPLADLLLQAESGEIIHALAHIVHLRQSHSLAAAMEEAHLNLIHAPTYLPLHALIGEILEEQGSRAQAVEKYATIARTHAVRGEGDRAVEFYRRALALDAMDLDLRLALIQTLVAQDRLVEAMEEYIDLAETYYRLAEVRLATNTYEHALRLTQRMPQEGSVWRLRILQRLADLAEQSLDWGRALRYYEQIRTLAPENLEAHWRACRMHLRLGQRAQALQVLDEALNQAEAQGVPLSERIATLEQLRQDFPAVPGILMRLAPLYARAERLREAVQTYDAAGELFLEQEDLPQAIQAVEALLALDPPEAEEYQRALQALRERLK